MEQNYWKLNIRAGAIFCGVAVVLGAFGAHALKDVLPEWYDALRASEKLEVWKTAVMYQLMHGFALLFVGLYARFQASRLLTFSSYAFAVGIFLFSGDLYLWVLTDISIFAMIVPLGGLSFILGWLGIVLTTFSRKFDSEGAS